MVYPKLVPRWACNAQCTVEIDGIGMTEDGAPSPGQSYTGTCNYQDEAKTVLDAHKREVVISGVALFDGDIFPDVNVIQSGKIVINDERRSIFRALKCRNPDNSVNYTRIEVQ